MVAGEMHKLCAGKQCGDYAAATCAGAEQEQHIAVETIHFAECKRFAQPQHELGKIRKCTGFADYDHTGPKYECEFKRIHADIRGTDKYQQHKKRGDRVQNIRTADREPEEQYNDTDYKSIPATAFGNGDREGGRREFQKHRGSGRAYKEYG